MTTTFNTTHPFSLVITLLITLLSTADLSSQNSANEIKNSAPVCQESVQANAYTVYAAKGFPTLECPVLQPLTAKDDNDIFDTGLVLKEASDKVLTFALTKNPNK